MDIVVIMFGSVISTMTALTFLEVRRIRKMAESKKSVVSASETPSSDRSVSR